MGIKWRIFIRRDIIRWGWGRKWLVELLNKIRWGRLKSVLLIIGHVEVGIGEKRFIIIIHGKRGRWLLVLANTKCCLIYSWCCWRRKRSTAISEDRFRWCLTAIGTFIRRYNLEIFNPSNLSNYFYLNKNF